MIELWIKLHFSMKLCDPISLQQDLLENGLNASNFAMLGLGDIVIPGIFIALLLRYDNSLKRGSNFYFYATFIGEKHKQNKQATAGQQAK